MEFKSKNVLIIGGTTGIGLATAQAFINAGARVWITGRNAHNLEEAARKINSENLNTLVSDTSKLSEITQLEQHFAATGNSLDVLFLNAGIATFSPLGKVTEAEFDAQFNTNVKGHFFTLQQFLPHLASNAAVIFTSSTVATASNAGGSVYSATKGALNKIATIAANELADKNIRVNIVSPGPIQTPGLDLAVPGDGKAYLASVTAMQRLGHADEVANAVLFLASDSASFITGTELVVDGGYLNYALK